jgi:hypothetical protein
LTRLRGNAGRLAIRNWLFYVVALGVGSDMAGAELDADEKRALRLPGNTGPFGCGYGSFQRNGRATLNDGSPLRRRRDGRGRHPNRSCR